MATPAPCENCGRYIFALRHLINVATLALNDRNQWMSHGIPKGDYLMLPETRAELRTAIETAKLALRLE